MPSIVSSASPSSEPPTPRLSGQITSNDSARPPRKAGSQSAPVAA